MARSSVPTAHIKHLFGFSFWTPLPRYPSPYDSFYHSQSLRNQLVCGTLRLCITCHHATELYAAYLSEIHADNGQFVTGSLTIPAYKSGSSQIKSFPLERWIELNTWSENWCPDPLLRSNGSEWTKRGLVYSIILKSLSYPFLIPFFFEFSLLRLFSPFDFAFYLPI